MLLNSHRFGPPNTFAQTVLQLECTGANNSTTFTDLSASTKTVTANGDAKVTTGIGVFPSGALLLDGTGDYLSVPNHADFNFPGEFWIECHAYFDAVVAAQCLLSNYQGTTAGWSLELSSGKLVFNATGDGVDLQGVTSLSATTKYKIAVGRWGTTMGLFLDGALEVSATISASITSTAALNIGRLPTVNADLMTGALGSIRIHKGVALAAGPFTPPSVPYPTS